MFQLVVFGIIFYKIFFRQISVLFHYLYILENSSGKWLRPLLLHHRLVNRRVNFLSIASSG
jgi:hypothetical protein